MAFVYSLLFLRDRTDEILTFFIKDISVELGRAILLLPVFSIPILYAMNFSYFIWVVHHFQRCDFWAHTLAFDRCT